MASRSRLPSRHFEEALRAQGYERIAGVDEAGRGCLAGPVVAAAVILAPDLHLPELADSKLLSRPLREQVAEAIRASASMVGVGLCSPQEIDRLNILHAAMEAMRRAAEDLASAPDYLLIDGNRCFPDPPCPAETLVQGDRRCRSIAAASVIAKVERDRMMRQLHEAYPVYAWNANAGYPVKKHYAALARHGPSPHHRRSFRLS